MLTRSTARACHPAAPAVLLHNLKQFAFGFTKVWCDDKANENTSSVAEELPARTNHSVSSVINREDASRQATAAGHSVQHRLGEFPW